PTERRHRACPIERQRSCLHDGFSVAEPSALVFKTAVFRKPRKKQLEILNATQRQPSPVCEAATNSPFIVAAR
ncbi:MAG: hypothetical protein K1Y36_30510, partial [Blastocatellia bacterium]|nr:hypothetical protein [Blastocatellia bacterium]